MNKFKTILISFAILFCNSLLAQKKKDSLPQLKLIEIAGIGYSTNMIGPGIHIFFEAPDSTLKEFNYNYSIGSKIDFTPPLELTKKEFNIHYRFDNSKLIQKINIDTTLSNGTIVLSFPRLCNQKKQGEIIYFYKNTDSIVNSYCDSLHHFTNRVSHPKGKIEITVYDSTNYIKTEETLILRKKKIDSILTTYGWKDEQIIFKTGKIKQTDVIVFPGIYFGSELVYLVYPSFNDFAPADVGMSIRYLE